VKTCDKLQAWSDPEAPCPSPAGHQHPEKTLPGKISRQDDPEKTPPAHEKKPNLEYKRNNLCVDLPGLILVVSHNSAEAQKK